LSLIERARADLARRDDRADGVHEARKAFKRVRAIARLVRSCLGADWRAEDRFWRDLGRALSAERDAQAVIEAYDALMGADADAPGFHALRALLVRRQEAAARAHQAQVVRFPGPEAEATPVDASADDDLDARLAAATERVLSWPLSEGFRPLAEGLEAGYRRARRLGGRALREQSAARLHAWRRAVKQHGAQVRLFRDTAAGPVGAHLALIDQLSDRLGDDHDLEVLRALLAEEEAAWADPHALDVLLERMARRHAMLRRAAFSLAERALAEQPAAFRRRMRRYWRAFVRDTVGERAEPTRAVEPAEDGPASASPDEAAGA
jgi:CHAD domain-containing protein